MSSHQDGLIDVHTHYVPKGWPDLCAVTGSEPGAWPSLRLETEREAMIMLGGKGFRRITDTCWDPDVRLADMDEDGVATQVVSPTPVFFGYQRSADEAVKVARIFNDLALEICAGGQGRLLPFAQVPLQDPDLACEELDRCRGNGHVGVEIGNHIGPEDLDNEGVVTFLQHCAATNTPVFVHPWDMPSSPRLDRWMAQWLVGMPAETHLSLLALILGGVFDRVPDTLRIAFAHGGGSYPMWVGRADNAWHHRGDVVRGASSMPPSSYAGRFYVDSVVFTEPALRLLIDVVGADRVVVGSDYPYPLGERPAGAVVARSDLDSQTRLALRRGNATRFLFGS